MSYFFIAPLVLEIFMPIIEHAIRWTYAKVTRLLDRKFKPSGEYWTKSKTALGYAEINSGPEIEYFEKYPRFLNLAFLAMLYGFIMPYFFLLVVACFLTNYIVDRWAVVFFYRKSPMYDNSMTKNMFFYLKWSALVYSCIAWWNLTNP